MEQITSTANQKIVEYAKIKIKKYRDKNGLFIIEGKNLISECPKDLIVDKFSTIREKGFTYISDNVMKKLSSFKVPLTQLAVCRSEMDKKYGHKVLYLDNLQDPGNVGTLIRSAVAFGFDSVVVKGVDVHNSKVIQASQGSFFKINVWNVKEYPNNINKPIICAVVDSESQSYNKIYNFKELVLVLGNEGQGISKEMLDIANHKAYIPIEFESLNVSSAGAILLNHFKSN